jgi:hypothetical protein
MGWLRLDDGFAMHPKIAALSDRDYRAWTKVLLYCARYRTQGDVPDHAFREIGINAQSRRKFIAVGLLDLDADGITSIHDWADFNPPDPTNAERQKRWRERQKEAKRNAGRNAESNASNRYDGVTEPLRDPSRAPARDPSTYPSTSLGEEVSTESGLVESEVNYAAGLDEHDQRELERMNGERLDPTRPSDEYESPGLVGENAAQEIERLPEETA